MFKNHNRHDVRERQAGEQRMLDRHGLWRSIVRFSLPVIGCGIVQQSFNSIDLAVVGRMVSSSALAAVGANGPVISLIITLFMGLALGSNVVISRALGARNDEVVRRTVATQAMVAVVAGVFLLIVGIGLSAPLLASLDTPDDILPSATRYLRIYALGFPAMLVYNFMSAVLRSMGDTRRPFLWLVIGGVVNLALNLMLVYVFGMGVEGVAIATSVSNVVSAAGVTLKLMRTDGPTRFVPGQMRIYASEFWAMVRIGLPAGIQGTLFAFSNVIIQSALNRLGASAMAGSAAALTYELYGYFVISAFVQAALAFVSINYGAGQYDNCRRIMWRCMVLALGGSFVLNSLVVLNNYTAVAVLTSSSEAIHYGMLRISNVLLWQFVACSYEISGTAMRALGHSLTPMMITLLGTCVMRVWWVRLSGFILDFNMLMAIYPITWFFTGCIMMVAYFFVSHRAFSHPCVKLVK